MDQMCIAGQSSEGVGSPALPLEAHPRELLGTTFSREKGVSGKLSRQTPERCLLPLPNIQVKWLICHQLFYLSLGTVSQFFQSQTTWYETRPLGAWNPGSLE